MTWLFFFFFIIVQIFTWAFRPNYNQQINIGYNPLKGNPQYDIPTNLFLPAFAILDGDVDGEDFVVNDF